MRVRYWFTDEETAVSVAHCDYAAIGNDKITAVAGSNGTQHYVDVTFSQAAGALNAGSSTGAIYLRIHHDNWTPYDENDDYSFSLAQVDFIDWQNVTLYHNDQLIWGVEP
jgi:cellulose 1,4-beta-cellobiosidase